MEMAEKFETQANDHQRNMERALNRTNIVEKEL